MTRGGKREGAGRKAQGITRKVSLTLSSEDWDLIDSSGKTVGEGIRKLIRKPEREGDSITQGMVSEDDLKGIRESIEGGYIKTTNHIMKLPLALKWLKALMDERENLLSEIRSYRNQLDDR